MNITIVLGYGVFKEDNLQYKGYLDDALKLIEENKSDLVVTTGGFSNKDLPNLSEAASVRDYFIKVSPNLADKIIFEEQALSTPQNLEFCKKLLEDKNISWDKLYITCDSIRLPKISYLALSCFKNLSEKEIIEQIGQRFLDKKINVLETSDL